MSTRTGWRTRLLIATALAMVAILGFATTAHAVAPTQPLLKDVWVSGVRKVTVQWYASTDASGHAVSYDIYRDVIPVTSSTISSRALSPVVTGFSGTTVQVNATALEASQSYVWFYAVVAKDDQSTPATSAPSLNMAPNLHGYRFDTNLIACTRCHSAHGVYKIPYTEKGSCYTCHGGTGFTAPLGAKSTFNTEASFYDTGTVTPGSRHRNQYMTDTKQECAACHTPHRTPYYYNASGVYDAASSYRRMLRVEYATGAYAYYSRASAPAQSNEFCFSCHGGSAVTWDGKTINASSAIGIVGGASAYANAGGDHNYAGYAASAHGTGVIYSNDYDGSALTTDNPAVQCEACHHNHASATDKLIDYRSSDTTIATKWAQAGLCYGCHSAASNESSVSGGNAAKPFAWNGRDVKAQFQKVSHHPTVARVGDPVAEPGTWSQTQVGDFDDDALTNTLVVAGGSGTSGAVQLAPVYSSSILLTEGFESGTFTANGWTDPAQWVANGTTANTGTYAAQLTSTGTAYDTYFQKSFNTSALTDAQVSFYWAFNGSGTTDYFGVQVSTDGSTFSDLMPATLSDQTTYTQATYPLPSGPTVYIRFNARVNATGEYARVDDVVVSGLATNGYLNSGNVVSTPIPVGAGSISSWTAATYTINQPAGSTIAVDVLDAADDSVILSGISSGASLSGVTASSIKLRARMAGNAPTPRVVSDDFNDNSFDTAKWADVYIGSTDADAAYTTTLRSITFGTALLDTLTGMDSRSPDSDSTGWYRSTNNGSDGSAGYAQTGTGNTTADRVMLKNFGDLSSLSSVDASFYWRNGGSTMTTGDYLYVEWSSNGGSTWSTIGSVTSTAADTTWGQLSATGLSTGTDCQLRVRARVASGSDSYWLDTIAVTGQHTATSIWPREANTQLTLRAEGTRIGGGGTADEGEFTYIKPTAADWVDTQDWDMIVAVPSYSNLPASGWMKTGLMVRTGSTEANAYAGGAIMAGVFVTDTNGVVFQSRTAISGAATVDAAGAGDAPVYLKLSRRGSTITGYKSSDGVAWQQVGSQSLTLGTYVLPGMCLTSSVNGQFSEATYNDFSVTESTGSSSVTPRLDDWTVTYQWIPSPTTGSLTCVNCHNVHYAGRGTAGTVWQMVRAALPSNTKVNYSGSPTQFCLECHDGSAPAAPVTTETTIVPYAVEFSAQAGSPFFPGWNKAAADVSWANSSHWNSAVQNMTPGCNTCHDPHASDNKRLTGLTAFYVGASPPGTHVNETRNNSATYNEQNLCYACHTEDRTPNCAGGACHGGAFDALNVQTAFGLAYRHPVEVSGRHSDTETATGLGASNRHSECADCHDPHAARSGLHTEGSSLSGGALRGAIGIKPVASWPGNWTVVAASGWTTERMTGEAGDVEAYVCLKCHSSYSGQPFSVTTPSNPAGYTSSDLALEFNPSNFSEHNVLGQSVGMEDVFTVGGTTYTWTKPADSAFLLSPWTSNSMMTCTSCHTNSTAAAKGPHGSSAQWLIDARGSATVADWKTTYLSNTTNGMSNTTNICAKCHTSLLSVNDVHAEGSHQGSTDGRCNNCHVGIPHGWKRPRLIGYTTDPAPYKTIAGGLEGIVVDDESPTGWSQTSDCLDAGCYGNEHNATGTLW